MVSANKRDGETTNALIFRFTRKVRRSGLLQEVRKRRFQDRPTTRTKRKLSAIFKSEKKAEVAKAKKLGLL